MSIGTDLFQLSESKQNGAVIKVIGIGGGGQNAIAQMINNSSSSHVEFVAANTDAQPLSNCQADVIIQMGEDITKGLGAGADPGIGRKAAEEDREKIIDIIQGCDMVFITAGMGGGTGTGAAPVFAEIAKNMGILTVAVVTKPFSFEGKKRMEIAEEGIQQLKKNVDSLITIHNDKLLSVLGKTESLLNAFRSANSVLEGAVLGIADLITKPGLINVDFADVRTVMSQMGLAMMGTGIAKGEERAKLAAELAIHSPLLDNINLTGAKGVLVNITAGIDMSIGEFEIVGETIRSFTSENATIVIGTVIDTDISDELKVTVVVTGIQGEDDAPEAEETPTEATSTPAEATEEISPVIEQPPVEATTMQYSDDATQGIDYSMYEKPAIMRRKTNTSSPRSNSRLGQLGIPAFLRKEEITEDATEESS